MDEDTISRIPGAAELVAWFGRFPSFHDANLIELLIGIDGSVLLKLKAFRMTDQVDEKGFFILDRHFECTVRIEETRSIDLREFQPGWAIVFGLSIRWDTDAFAIELESSYGVRGRIFARAVSVEFAAEPTA